MRLKLFLFVWSMTVAAAGVAEDRFDYSVLDGEWAARDAPLIGAPTWQYVRVSKNTVDVAFSYDGGPASHFRTSSVRRADGLISGSGSVGTERSARLVLSALRSHGSGGSGLATGVIYIYSVDARGEEALLNSLFLRLEPAGEGTELGSSREVAVARQLVEAHG
jgi:hypothetical protein